VPAWAALAHAVIGEAASPFNAPARKAAKKAAPPTPAANSRE
ncbi:MAG: hypothetical protein QOH97_3593, partial [Actinoplanes sp.]|nr:hypothetical protein [Actinoplanes sp.]